MMKHGSTGARVRHAIRKSEQNKTLDTEWQYNVFFRLRMTVQLHDRARKKEHKGHARITPSIELATRIENPLWLLGVYVSIGKKLFSKMSKNSEKEFLACF
jgi:hypothetical protein